MRKLHLAKIFGAKAFDRESFARLADALAVALVVSLPWSTSATGILAVLWLIAFIPSCDLAGLRRTVLTPAGCLPVILVALGVAGMLWADVTWAERFDGVGSFLKLLFIPLLLHRFSRSNAGRNVLLGFLLSCAALLLLSWMLTIFPAMPWIRVNNNVGVPVKDYISQSAMFTICIFAILQLAYEKWRGGLRWLAAILVVIAIVFLANVFYVATARTSLVVLPILLVVFGLRLFGWKGAIGMVLAFLLLAAAAWPSAHYLRQRVDNFFLEVRTFDPNGNATSAGERLEFWSKSVRFIGQAPIVGHGTGSIRELFARAAVGKTGMAGQVAVNPHNQIFAVGIQLGFIGIAALLAMWAAHVLLFRGPGFAAWIGLVVALENVIGSLFNSHLFDFTHGWLYVIGIGIAGGIVMRQSAAPSRGRCGKTI